MLMLAWALALTDESLAEEELARLDAYAEGLGIGTDRAATLHPNAARNHHLARVVTNLAVLDFASPDGRMRLVSTHPGVDVDDVVAATGFALTIDGEIGTTRGPTTEEADAIERLDPRGLRHREVPEP